MRIAALMMVRDEAAIIADAIGHLLHGVRVDRIYVADNGSTDATPSLLGRMAALDKRVRIRHAPGAFRQVEVLEAMLQEAIADGMDWLLQNDADEFLWLDRARLEAICAAAAGAGGLKLEVRNFVQFRSVARDRPGSIETMLFAARPEGTAAEAQARVQAGLPFVRIRYGPKMLLRAAASIRLFRGGHGGIGLAGPVPPWPVADLLHAPIRARNDLDSRVAMGERVLALREAPDISWHLKRLVGMSPAALDAEWQANSVGPWPGRGFRPDLRLSRLSFRLRRFRRAVLAGVQPAASFSSSPGLARGPMSQAAAPVSPLAAGSMPGGDDIGLGAAP